MIRKATALLLTIPMLFTIGCAKDNEGDISNTNAKDKIHIYTSIYPIYDFAKKVGGDKVEVTNLVPAGTEPHDWEVSTSDIINLEKADMLIYNGAGIENWTDKIISTLENEEIVFVKTSEGIELNKIEEHEHEGEEEHDHEHEEEHNHDHGPNDPHTWLSIENAKKEMENIKDALVEYDSKNKEYYEENYAKYEKKFDELDTKYEEILDPIKDKKIIVTHEAFGYLCEEYDIEQIAIEGLTPYSEPDPAKMKEIIEFAKENDVKTIFFEELVNPKVATTIANELGAKTAVLSPLEGLSEEQTKNNEDYFSVMEKNLEQIHESMK